MNYDDTAPNQKILWSCVARNDTVLAEAALDYSDGVFQTAKELLAKKATPGFEYHTQNRWKARRGDEQQRHHQLLKGIKFHVYEHEAASDEEDDSNDLLLDKSSNSDRDTTSMRIWVFAAVYDPTAGVTKHDVQSFLEKIVTISENFRPDWTGTATLGLQSTFAPILKQRMEEVTYYGKMALLDQQIQACQQTMQDNIEVILQNGERMEDLERSATQLQEMAGVFKKRARKLRRFQMMKNAKHGIILGTVVTAATAAVVIPPLVAIL